MRIQVALTTQLHAERVGPVWGSGRSHDDPWRRDAHPRRTTRAVAVRELLVRLWTGDRLPCPFESGVISRSNGAGDPWPAKTPKGMPDWCAV